MSVRELQIMSSKILSNENATILLNSLMLIMIVFSFKNVILQYDEKNNELLNDR